MTEDYKTIMPTGILAAMAASAFAVPEPGYGAIPRRGRGPTPLSHAEKAKRRKARKKARKSKKRNRQ